MIFIITIEFQIIYGIYSPTVVITLKNLGAIYERQGKNDVAQMLKKVTLRTKREVLLKFV